MTNRDVKGYGVDARLADITLGIVRKPPVRERQKTHTRSDMLRHMAVLRSTPRALTRHLSGRIGRVTVALDATFWLTREVVDDYCTSYRHLDPIQIMEQLFPAENSAPFDEVSIS